MLTWTEYFRPENPIALAIVYILWGVFVVWLLSLVRGGARIGRHGRSIQALVHATADLVAAQRERQDRRARGLKSDTTPSDEFRSHLPPEVAQDEPVAIHLENIYAAGCSESRLDIGELLSNTERMISQGDSVRLHFLSIFLIIGLLGTLFGLADSILALLLLLKQDADVGSNLAALLGSLKGAFAPSISGVLTSIVGTGVLAVYNRAYVSPLIGQLREATINFWVPELYPTTGQVAAEAAQRSLEAAGRVIKSSERISEDTEKLASTLKSAVEDTQSYATAIDTLSGAIQAATAPVAAALAGITTQLTRFDEAMARWAQFEKTLQTLHEELSANQKLLAAGATQIAALIASQTQSLEKMSSSLESTHREAFKDVAEKFSDLKACMNSLQAPFNNAAEQMLNQNVLLHTYVETQLARYGEVFDTIKHLPGDLVDAGKTLAEMVAQTVRDVEESRRKPFDDVRRDLAADFSEQNQILRDLIREVQALNRQPASKPSKRPYEPYRPPVGTVPQEPPSAVPVPSPYPPLQEPPPPDPAEPQQIQSGSSVPPGETVLTEPPPQPQPVPTPYPRQQPPPQTTTRPRQSEIYVPQPRPRQPVQPAPQPAKPKSIWDRLFGG